MDRIGQSAIVERLGTIEAELREYGGQAGTLDVLDARLSEKLGRIVQQLKVAGLWDTIGSDGRDGSDGSDGGDGGDLGTPAKREVVVARDRELAAFLNQFGQLVALSGVLDQFGTAAKQLAAAEERLAGQGLTRTELLARYDAVYCKFRAGLSRCIRLLEAKVAAALEHD